MTMSTPNLMSTGKWLSKKERRPLQQLYLTPPNFVFPPTFKSFARPCARAERLVGSIKKEPSKPYFFVRASDSCNWLHADTSLFVRNRTKLDEARNGKTPVLLHPCQQNRQLWTSFWSGPEYVTKGGSTKLKVKAGISHTGSTTRMLLSSQ